MAFLLTANWVTKHLAATAEKIRFTYHMFGTYIAYGTVLFVIYCVNQNYVAFGYLCLLLFWIIGRQVLGRSEKGLWFPLLVYSAVVFVLRYILNSFSDLQQYVNTCIPLYPDLGFDPQASLLQHIWDPLAILIVMEVFKFERNQKVLESEDSEQAGDHINAYLGYVGFMKRLLILHSGKFLSVAVFYAAVTPVSAIGFLYLIMLVVTCNMSKTSRLPGQTFALYTSLIIVSEYLYQMWGQDLMMFPGQSHGEFAYWLGLRVFDTGFWGIEAGLRSRVVVLVMCILQCTTLGWLDLLPASLRIDEQYEEPCFLFLPYVRTSRSNLRDVESTDPLLGKVQVKRPTSEKQPVARSQSLQLNSTVSDSIASNSSVRRVKHSVQPVSKTESNGPPKLESAWGSLEGRRWTKRAMELLKQVIFLSRSVIPSKILCT